jgi:hypothetical protein
MKKRIESKEKGNKLKEPSHQARALSSLLLPCSTPTPAITQSSNLELNCSGHSAMIHPESQTPSPPLLFSITTSPLPLLLP